MPYSKYYTKYSPREAFWSKIIARIVLAILTFGGSLFTEIAFVIYGGTKRFYSSSDLIWKLSEQADAEGIPFFMVFLKWPFLIIPIAFSIIILVFPNTLKELLSTTKHCTLEEVKDFEEKIKPLSRATTLANGRGELHHQ